MDKEAVLSEVNKIFDILQSKPWQEHSPGLLSAAQGRMASFMPNVIALAVDAQYEYELRELNASQYEADKFLHYRRTGGMTLDESKYEARIDVKKKREEVLLAQKEWQELKGIVEAMKNLSVACSTSLKHYESERISTKYQGN